MRRERSLVRLGPAQLVVVLCGLLTALVVGAILVGPAWWHDRYALEYGLPRLEHPWGFKLGTIRFQHGGEMHEWLVPSY